MTETEALVTAFEKARPKSVVLQLEEPLRIVEGVGPSADSDRLEGWEHRLLLG